MHSFWILVMLVISNFCLPPVQWYSFWLISGWKMGQVGCLSTHSYLEGLGHGHMQRYASHVVTLHMINGICCITGYTMAGSLPSYCIIWYSSFAFLLLYIEMSPSTTLFSLSFVRYVSFSFLSLWNCFFFFFPFSSVWSSFFLF